MIGEDIELATKPAPMPLWVRADPMQLEQVLINLVANARDAMPLGRKLTVEVAEVALDARYAATHPEVEPGPHVMIAVSDTGSGMSDEVREHAFEPFYTTREVAGGAGLGLATVYGIVKQSGGSIGVYSEPGRGAVFKVYLPRVFETPDERTGSAVDQGRSHRVLPQEQLATVGTGDEGPRSNARRGPDFRDDRAAQLSNEAESGLQVGNRA